jgi:excisionase family DNA binding protein
MNVSIIRITSPNKPEIAIGGRKAVIVPEPLQRLIERETFEEIIQQLTCDEMAVALLRLEGLSDPQIGAVLGLTRAAVSLRMQEAMRRIAAETPELAPVLEGRQISHKWQAEPMPPLEAGWLLAPGAGGEELPPDVPMGLRVRDAAYYCGVSSGTLRRWLREGRFPNAYRLPDGRREYRIPWEDLPVARGA